MADIKDQGPAVPSPIHFTSAATPHQSELTMTGIERITRACFVPPATIELEFVDGLTFSLAVELLDLPLDRMNWATLRTTIGGEKIIVDGIKGDPVPIDAATLRYLVDPNYAAKLDAKLKSLQFTEEELERLVRDNPPPPEWFSQPSRDLTRESWK
jgi:hypothetical protein